MDLIPRTFAIAISGEIPKYLTKDEVHRVLEVIPKNKARDHLIINLLWHSGVRVSELISIKYQDIDFYAHVLNIQTLKQKKGKEKKIYRSIPLQDNILNELGNYTFEDEERLFPITRKEVWYLVRRYCKKAGIGSKNGHPHVFRHSFAINAILQGVSPGTLAGWLGHASLASTMVYSKVLAKDTRQIMDGLEF
jgi:integrase/recombinase XerD